MAYTPINWDELTPINIANLNKMDGEIDSNESRVTTAESELDDIDSNGDGRVNSADYAVNADNAGNADLLNGKKWVEIVSGSVTGSDVSLINLETSQQHNYYNISIYSPEDRIVIGYHTSTSAHIQRRITGNNDVLYMSILSSGATYYYSVLSWK